MQSINRQWLIELRKKRGFKQGQVADLLFIDKAYYSRIERGERNPSPEVARNIADLLRFHYSIFTLENNPFKEALSNSSLVVAQFDLELRYTWISNTHPLIEPLDMIGKRDDEISFCDGVLSLMQVKREVISSGQQLTRTLQFYGFNEKLIYQVIAHPLRNKEIIIGGTTISTLISNHKIGDSQTAVLELQNNDRRDEIVKELSDQMLIDAYKEAIILKLNSDFIGLLEKEMIKRMKAPIRTLDTNRNIDPDPIV